MKLGHVELFVNDMQKSIDFYRLLGCEVTVEQNEGRTVWLKSGEAEILLRKWDGAKGAGKRYGDHGAGLVFYVDDEPAAHARLAEAGVLPSSNDTDGCPLFLDPDGNWIQFVNPEG